MGKREDDIQQAEELLEEMEAQQVDMQLQILEDVKPSNLTIFATQRPLFPGVLMPVSYVGTDTLIGLHQVIEKENGLMGIVYPKHQDEIVDSKDFYKVGTLVKINKVLPIDTESVEVFLESINRFEYVETISDKPLVKWKVAHYNQVEEELDSEMKAYMLAISNIVRELIQLSQVFREQVNMMVSQLNYNTPGLTIDVLANVLTADEHVLQDLLETFNMKERAKKLLKLLQQEEEIARIQHEIGAQVNANIDKQQREFFLHEQLKTIKEELGLEKDGKEAEIEKIASKLAKLSLPEEVAKEVNDTFNKLKLLNSASPDFNVTLSYLDLVTELPWGIFSEDNDNISEARKILDEDHYGLQDVKNLILEFLSTIIRRGRVGGSVICLVGPPGVGKTSIGKSIARSLNRQFFRFSVGGMKDEAEIKGHRRTYIGAMAGKLIQALKRVGTANPIIMLDEIDKIGNSYQGDPASALLEVLDPEQNSAFLDHYLDLPFDLSNVLFITTANQLDTIPAPLLDRMEIIRLSGYVLEEKVEIAKRYLIPRQLEGNGFKKSHIKFNVGALKMIVDQYAREAGVRQLEKLIGKIIRKISLEMSENGGDKFKVTKENVIDYLGAPYFSTEQLYNDDVVGSTLGLAYTSMGGATLYIEANAIPAKAASFKQTGQLGEVMKESSEIAYSYVRALMSKQDKANDFFEKHHVHLHVPEGATPKDGPSAGITMALALYSLAINRPIKQGFGMTGELTLTGKVLAIGGVKEKTIGAKRVGVKKLIFPLANQKDFEELPDYIKKGIKAHFVDYFDDVLKIVF